MYNNLNLNMYGHAWSQLKFEMSYSCHCNLFVFAFPIRKIYIYQVYEFEITTAHTCFLCFFYWCYFHNSGINREYKFEYLVHNYINMLTFVFKLHGITLVICTQ